MIADFESRLADVLGSRLAAPFAGRVFVSPGPPSSAVPALLVGVSRADVLPGDFGSTRPEPVPGADDPRRVVRLRCTVRIEARASGAGGRPERMAALDAVLYELDAPDLRTAVALRAPGDPGFLLSSQVPQGVVVDGAQPGQLPSVLLQAEGWFWPLHAPGAGGPAIRSALVRAALLPVGLEPWPLDLRAGGPPAELSVRLGAVGTMKLDGGEPSSLPFGALALRVVDAGGRAGAGTLAGGTAGPAGARIVALDAGAVAVQYLPPATPAKDVLVVAVARPDTGGGAAVGAELARFALDVAP